jgi:hypothetical protein
MLQSPCSLNLSAACKHYATPKKLQKRVENWIKLLTKRDQDKLGTRYQWHKVRTLKISLLSRTTALVYQMKVGEVQAQWWGWPLPMLYVVLKPKCERARLWFVLHGDYWNCIRIPMWMWSLSSLWAEPTTVPDISADLGRFATTLFCYRLTELWKWTPG